MNIVILSIAEEEFAEAVDYYNAQCTMLNAPQRTAHTQAAHVPACLRTQGAPART